MTLQLLHLVGDKKLATTLTKQNLAYGSMAGTLASSGTDSHHGTRLERLWLRPKRQILVTAPENVAGPIQTQLLHVRPAIT